MKKQSIKNCEICTLLSDKETAYQKYGSNYPDTFLPEASGRLTILKDFKPLSERKLQLRQCPICGTYYLYTTDYEYYMNGSEDEQTLTRLTYAEAEIYLHKPEIM